MWDGTDVEIPVGILFMTVKGAHASLPPRAVPLLWPRESASNPELSQDRIRALRGPRPSSRRLLISTSRDLLIINPCVCDAMHVAMNAGDQWAIGAVTKRGAGRVTRAYNSHVESHTCMSLLLFDV